MTFKVIAIIAIVLIFVGCGITIWVLAKENSFKAKEIKELKYQIDVQKDRVQYFEKIAKQEKVKYEQLKTVIQKIQSTNDIQALIDFANQINRVEPVKKPKKAGN